MLRLRDRSLGCLLVKLDKVIRFEGADCCLVVVELVECRLGGATTRRSVVLCLKSNVLVLRFLLFYKRTNYHVNVMSFWLKKL